MKILLIGPGYVGLSLLKKLKGHTLYTTTTRTEKIATLEPFAKTILVEPDSLEALAPLLPTLDAIILTIAPNPGATYEKTYYNITSSLLALLNTAKPYLLYTSSTSVYEGAFEPVVTEETHIAPLFANGKILKKTEDLLLAYGKGAILRLGGIYGPSREIEKRALYFSGKPQATEGSEPTNHIHLDDVVGGICFALEKRLQGIFNLVNCAHPTRKELYDRLCQELSLPLPLWGKEKGQGYLVSNAKIQSEGFEFTHASL